MTQNWKFDMKWPLAAATFVLAETLLIGPLAFKLSDVTRWQLLTLFTASAYFGVFAPRLLAAWGAQPTGRTDPRLIGRAVGHVAAILWLAAIIAPQSMVSHPVKAALSAALALLALAAGKLRLA